MPFKFTREGEYLQKIKEQNDKFQALYNLADNSIINVIPQTIQDPIHSAIKINIGYDTYVGRFSNVLFMRPTISTGAPGQRKLMYPSDARKSDLNYFASISATFQLFRYNSVTGVEEPFGKSEQVSLGGYPALLGSYLDNLHGMTAEERYRHGDGQLDKGGYYIVKGREIVLLKYDRLAVNRPLLYEVKTGPTVRYTAETFYDQTMIIVEEDPKETDIILMKLSGTGALSSITINAVTAVYVLLNKFINPSSHDHIAAFTDLFYKIYDSLISGPDSDERKKRARFVLKKTFNTFLNKHFSLVGNEPGSVILNPPDRTEQKYVNTGIEEIYQMYSSKFSREKCAEFWFYQNIFRNIHFNASNCYNEEGIKALKKKGELLIYMISMFVDHKLGFRDIINKNAWANKVQITAPNHVETQFKRLWRLFIDNLRKETSSGNLKSISAQQIVVKMNAYEKITEPLISMFTSGSWGDSKGPNSKDIIIVDTLKAENLLSRVSHVFKANAHTTRKGKAKEARLIYPDSFNRICPVSTPEGEGCGVVRTDAQTMIFTMYRNPERILNIIKKYVSPNPTSIWKNPIFVNGVPEGFCDGNSLRHLLLEKRRHGIIYFDTGLTFNDFNELHVETSGGRLIAPYFIVNPDTQNLYLVEIPGMENADLQTWLTNGIVEYLDVSEEIQRHTYIAEQISYLDSVRKKNEEIIDQYKQISRQKEEYDRQGDGYPPEFVEKLENVENTYLQYQRTAKFTHSFIDPNSMFSLEASTIPFATRNQGPRLTYQTAMSKQALAANAFNQENRFDTTGRHLAKAEVPIVSTEGYEALGLDEFPMGKSAIVAVAPIRGFNQEDAIVVNLDTLNNGFFESIDTRAYKTEFERVTSRHEELTIPPHSKNDAYKYRHLETEGTNRGIVKLRTDVQKGDCLIGKISVDVKAKEKNIVDVSVFAKKDGTVINIEHTRNSQGNHVVKVILGQIRIPEVGDKFASRYAQKGVIGAALPASELPSIYSPENPIFHGIVPDIFFDPHGFPTRMTIGLFMEHLAGLYGALSGIRQNATSYREFDMEKILKDLEETYGLSKTGTFKMIHPQFRDKDGNAIDEHGNLTDNPRLIEEDIFIGVVYYQQLKHFVREKMQGRSLGSLNILTRQPLGGVRVDGTIRAGEMEITAIVQYGAEALLKDMLITRSDKYESFICKNCGNFVGLDIRNLDEETKIQCQTCGDYSVGNVQIPYVFKLFSNYLAAMGLRLKPNIQFKE